MRPVSYVLPLRASVDTDHGDLFVYLQRLVHLVDDVIVVDGSAGGAFVQHARQLPPTARHVAPRLRTPNGKVGNVLEGVALARHDLVVIGDDDVRWDAAALDTAMTRIGDAAVLRPHNVFDPLVWHARVDSARAAINRALDGDWPGTLVVRRSALVSTGGYRGDVLFENLELVRTLRAAGGREVVAPDIVVARRPPTTQHFARQQVRQAYDELARPERLIVSLLVLPLTVAAVTTRRWTALATGALALASLAELGRRRAGGDSRLPRDAALYAPAWALWRSGCSWVALGARARGGAHYRGGRLRVAASSRRALARLHGRVPLRGARPGNAPTRNYAASRCVARVASSCCWPSRSGWPLARSRAP